MWEAPDLDVALDFAAEASKVCDRKIEKYVRSSERNDVEEAITRAHYVEWARVVAALTRRFR